MVIGCLLQATGILLLVNVGPAMLLPAVAFALMGAGKPLQQYGSEQRVFDDATGRYARCQRAMESESSVELFAGALLLAQALSFMQDYVAPLAARHGMFVLPQSSPYCPYCTSTVLTTRSYLRNCNRSNHDPFRTRDPRHSRRP